jgi:hypothetical protein
VGVREELAAVVVQSGWRRLGAERRVQERRVQMAEEWLRKEESKGGTGG